MGIGRRMRLSDLFKFMRSEESTFLEGPVTYAPLSQDRFNIKLQVYATAINYIATVIANSEFKVFFEGKEKKDDEWVLWNVRPDVNQNKTEFISELITKMCTPKGALIIEPVRNRLIIADSFEEASDGFSEIVYSSIRRGSYEFPGTYRRSEVMRLKIDGCGAIGLLSSLADEYEALMGAAKKKYRRNSGFFGFYVRNTLATGSQTEKEKYNEQLSYQIKEFLHKDDAVLTLPKDDKLEALNNGSQNYKDAEIDSINKLKQEYIKSVCAAFGLSPAIFTGEISGIEEAVNYSMSVGVKRFADAIATEITNARFKTEVKKGSFVKIDLSSSAYLSLEDEMNIRQKYISNGGSINEFLQLMGREKISAAWADEHWMTKNYDTIESRQRGEQK